ncbi:PhzF family phenazine biosynthesis protein [Gluconacetobacter takamatsuzukensis]|uniref:PhzF family phenazine biosynthesis protein n=1 Tax=Gluconacetobacter takamatsuzukensis TaxID=1286190 RepID=A0A7W4PS97_9PROT|nr:PhzF family phenazine biosynthesis protein [Gluconacetobacter takamatsuzukensis]MBB2206184.1 PhzF family phenazine biosynthesis protein [Gluconacetobacter takamatsuzukensis]
MTTCAFHQVDVFAAAPLKGNPLAVVAGADGLDDGQMAAFANWMNLSETTFLLKPTRPGADYRVRIFTPEEELPFAGHPTLGSCHVWLAMGGVPLGRDVVQECGAGLVTVRRDGDGLAFAAPPLRRAGPVGASDLETVMRGLGLSADRVVAANWVDNGPGWLGLMVRDRAELLALRPDSQALAGWAVGLVAPWDAARDGDAAQFEVRAFTGGAAVFEDPVTGSLNAGLAAWLIGAGLAPPSYVASQGTVLGRMGRVRVARDEAGIWIGGETVTRIAGQVTL